MRSGDGQGPGRVPSCHALTLRTRCLARAFTVLLVPVFMSGCSSSERVSSVDPELGVSASPRVVSETGGRASGPLPKGGGVYKVGNPYQIAGRWYHPREEPDYQEVGTASWYGIDFHGRKTANGEIYDMYALTAAHRTLPMPSYAYVTAKKTNRTILVRINDRGPFARNRILDLSMASAEALGLKRDGVGEVHVRYAGPAPLSGDDRHERRFLAAQSFGNTYAQSYRQPGRLGLGMFQQARTRLSYPAQPRSASVPAAEGWNVTNYRQSKPVR